MSPQQVFLLGGSEGAVEWEAKLTSEPLLLAVGTLGKGNKAVVS